MTLDIVPIGLIFLCALYFAWRNGYNRGFRQRFFNEIETIGLIGKERK